MVEALRRMFRSPHTALIEEIRGFCTLGSGWNSYRAPQIPETAIKAALEILDTATRRGAALPSAAPTPLGGIALTWTLEDGVEAQLLIDDESVDYSVARRGSPKVIDQGSLHGVSDVEKRFINPYLIHV